MKGHVKAYSGNKALPLCAKLKTMAWSFLIGGNMLAFAAALVVQPVTSEPTQAEVDALEVCIVNAPFGQEVSECEGLVSRPCLNTAGGMTTSGSIACIARELSIWDNELNTHYHALRTEWAANDWSSRADALQEAQRAWITYRDLECDQQSLEFEGGTLARVIRISCRMELTAERAMALKGQLPRG